MSTSSKPTRATVEGNAYLDLQATAKARGRPVDEYLTLYALEGFLDRLSESQWRSDFVLKGGVLLAAFDQRRPTRDVDLAAIDLDNEAENVLAVMQKIAAISTGDGLNIDARGATVETIRGDGDGYTGARVSFQAQLARATVSFHVDVNVGDPIFPEPLATSVPRILGGTIDLLGYPAEMVIAEKLVTAIERGAANTRWRDFVDMYRLSNSHPLQGSVLMESCATVARFRGVTLVPLEVALSGFAAAAQPRWAAWRRKQKLDKEAPEAIADLIAELEVFTEPLLTGAAAELMWDEKRREWR